MCVEVQNPLIPGDLLVSPEVFADHRRLSHSAAYPVAVDLRKGSPSLGKHFGTEVHYSSPRLPWEPVSFARGFCVFSDVAGIEYFTTGIYRAASDAGIRWNDPALGIEWSERHPTLSGKDRSAQTPAERSGWRGRGSGLYDRYHATLGQPDG